ncbi:MAG TPA: hypothetical protein VMD27_03230 [Candidatus Aquilonibacter sp.]|nr:hypothetical protein [Candidatus Aquilonibacter sp.]
MAKKSDVAADGSPPVKPKSRKSAALSRTPLRASSLLDTRVIYCGDNLEQLAKLPDACVDLIYPATAGRPRCVQLARVLKKTGSFYYHCDWHASHYVKVMLDQIFGENNFQNALVPVGQIC